MNHIDLAKQCGLLDRKRSTYDYAQRLELFALLILISNIPKYPPLSQLLTEYQFSREPK